MADVDRFTLRAFGVAFTLLLAYLLWLIFRPFVTPILWATLLAFILYPANAALRRRFHDRRGLAALVMTFGVLLGVVVPAGVLGVLFAKQAADLVARLSVLTARYQIEKPADLFRIPALDRAIRWIDAKTPVQAEDIQKWIVTTARAGLDLALSSGPKVVLGAVGAVASLLLMLFILYFYFRDGDDMARNFLGMVPVPHERKTRLVAYMSQVTRAVVYGTLLTALVQGALIALGFAVCGLPSPLVFGVIAAVLSLLPVGGTAFVWIPGALALIAQGRWGFAIGLSVWGALIVGSADNVLRPYFISGRAEISTLPVFFGVLGGIAAFGPIGTFAGPVVLALALALLRFLCDDNAGGTAAAPAPPNPASTA